MTQIIYEYHHGYSLHSPDITKLYIDRLDKRHYWIGDEKTLLVRSGVICFETPDELIDYSRKQASDTLIDYEKALIKARLNVVLANDLSRQKLLDMKTDWY